MISGQLDSAGQPYSAGRLAGTAARLAGTAARQMAAGQIGHLILVMLPAEIGHDQGCLDLPGGPQAATFVTEDLPQDVAAGYRVVPPASRRWAPAGHAGVPAPDPPADAGLLADPAHRRSRVP